MKRNIDCDDFRGQLDDLRQGSLPEDVAARLQRHASACRDCGMLLEMQERLAASGGAELEAGVPDEYVTTMWERVRAEIVSEGEERKRPRGDQRASRWLVPALAAASLFLLLASGLLFGEVKRLRARELALAQQIADHERWLTELDIRTRMDAIARTAGLAGSRAWERLLSQRDRISVAELEALLAGLPGRTTVVSRAEWRALEGGLRFWVGSVAGSATEVVEADDGVQAAELLDLLVALDLEPDRSVSIARILALKRAIGSGRL